MTDYSDRLKWQIIVTEYSDRLELKVWLTALIHSTYWTIKVLWEALVYGPLTVKRWCTIYRYFVCFCNKDIFQVKLTTEATLNMYYYTTYKCALIFLPFLRAVLPSIIDQALFWSVITWKCKVFNIKTPFLNKIASPLCSK